MRTAVRPTSHRGDPAASTIRRRLDLREARVGDLLTSTGLGLIALSAVSLSAVTWGPASLALDVGSRVVFDIGLFGLIGVALIAGWAFAEAPAGAGRAFIAAWAVYALGVAGQTESLAMHSETSVIGLLTFAPWRTDVLVRLLSMLCGGVLLRLALPRRSIHRRLLDLSRRLVGTGWGAQLPAWTAGGLRWLTLPRATLNRGLIAATTGVALLAMFVDDYADTAITHDSLLVVTIRWTHYVSSALWIGALGALLVLIRQAGPSQMRTRAIRRFSWAAAYACVAVGVSGVARAAGMLHSWPELTGTTFGRMVIVKVALFALLIALGAVNRFMSVPAASRSLRPLRWVSSNEVLIGLGAIAVSVAMLNMQPPA
jgi:putative copper export protein